MVWSVVGGLARSAMKHTPDTFRDSPISEHTTISPVHPYLFLVLECDRPTSQGARYALAGVDEVVIGRGAERSATPQLVEGRHSLVIRVPGRSMSSLHARLLRTGAGWILEDGHSTNGSFVNGYRVQQADLRDGDIIELGHTLFILREAQPTPPDTPRIFDALQNPPLDHAVATLLPELSLQFENLTRLATTELPILLLGETGTGKEVLARALHRLSGKAGPFVAVNCGALPTNLVESQLFGHVRGAFSGAHRDEPGFFRAAERGTLLLDEIGELPPSAQPALLRVLQEEELAPVGSTRTVKINIRVIAATHQPLDNLVDRGSFRGDLLARLDGVRFTLPNLHARREDLGLIISQIVRSLHQGTDLMLTAEAGLALVRHRWPFNARELDRALRRAVTLAGARPIAKSHLALTETRIVGSPAPMSSYRGSRPLTSSELKLRRELLLRLAEQRGNVARVAEGMGKARAQIHRWIKRFSIDPKSFRNQGGF